MKAFLAEDSDSYIVTYIITLDLQKAIDLYKSNYGYYPERIKDITADNATVIFDTMLIGEDK